MSKASSSFVSKIPTAEDLKETDFIGYEYLSSDSNVIAIWNKNEKVELANEPQEYFIALNQTSIYAESGGQVGDRGIFKSKNAEGSILDCKKSGKVFMHLIKLDKGSLKIDDKIEIRPMMYLALTYDHRLLDGKDAVSFLVKIKEILESPESMILGV